MNQSQIRHHYGKMFNTTHSTRLQTIWHAAPPRKLATTTKRPERHDGETPKHASSLNP
ncbi:MAG: hypothetical protein V3T42_00075 [Nitrospirales bacterium]